MIEGLPTHIFAPTASRDSSTRFDFLSFLPFLFVALVVAILVLSGLGRASEEQYLFFEITFLLLMALLAHMLADYVELPRVLVWVVLGIFLGNSFLGVLWEWLPSLQSISSEPLAILQHVEFLGVLGQIGIVLLMFKIGTHERIRDVLTDENLAVALLGILLPFAAGYGYAVYAGHAATTGLLMGTALSATSVAIAAALFREAHVSGTSVSKTVLGAAILDDILGLVLLVLILGIARHGEIQAVPLLAQLFVIALFLGGGFIVLNALLRSVIDDERFGGQSFLLVLFVLFLVSYTAEYLGLSAIVGAFLVGMVFAHSKHIRVIHHVLLGLEAAFLPMFFILVGGLVDVRIFATTWPAVLLLAAIAILSKFVGCALAALGKRRGFIESAIVGLAMAPRGEVALVVALFGRNLGLLDAATYSVLSGAVLLTMIVPPFLLGPLLEKVNP